MNLNDPSVVAHFTEDVMRHIETVLTTPGIGLNFVDFDPTVAPPLPMEMMQSNEWLSVLLVHPTWSITRDPSSWHERELKSLLFSKDVRDAYQELEKTSAPIDPAIWTPRHQSMLITGIFCRMPREVIWEIIPYLDLLTVSNLSRTCRYIRSAVVQAPVLKFIFQTIPAVPSVLSTANLLGRHTLVDLIAELGQLYCRTCGGYATSLFLPTCERTCINCLIWDQDFTLVPLAAIESAFNFSPAVLRELPIVRTYVRQGPWHSLNVPVGHYVVPVKCAIQKALELYGDLNGIVRAARDLVPWAYNGIEPYQVTPEHIRTHISNECIALNFEPFLEPHASISTGAAMETYMGRGSMNYPYLPPAGTVAPELGFCRGCLEALAVPYPFQRDHMDYMGWPRTIAPGEMTMIMTRRARVFMTWEEMLNDHLPHCIGAHMLMYENFHRRTPVAPPAN